MSAKVKIQVANGSLQKPRSTTPIVDDASRAASATERNRRAVLAAQSRKAMDERDAQEKASVVAKLRHQSMLNGLATKPLTAYCISYEGDRIGYVLIRLQLEGDKVLSRELVDAPDMRSIVINRLHKILIREDGLGNVSDRSAQKSA